MDRPIFCEECDYLIPEIRTKFAILYSLCGRVQKPPFKPGFPYCGDERKGGFIACRLTGKCGEEGRFFKVSR